MYNPANARTDETGRALGVNQTGEYSFKVDPAWHKEPESITTKKMKPVNGSMGVYLFELFDDKFCRPRKIAVQFSLAANVALRNGAEMYEYVHLSVDKEANAFMIETSIGRVVVKNDEWTIFWKSAKALAAAGH